MLHMSLVFRCLLAEYLSPHINLPVSLLEQLVGSGTEKGQMQLFCRDVFEVLGVPGRRVVHFAPLFSLRDREGRGECANNFCLWWRPIKFTYLNRQAPDPK